MECEKAHLSYKLQCSHFQQQTVIRPTSFNEEPFKLRAVESWKHWTGISTAGRQMNHLKKKKHMTWFCRSWMKPGMENLTSKQFCVKTTPEPFLLCKLNCFQSLLIKRAAECATDSGVYQGIHLWLIHINLLQHDFLLCLSILLTPREAHCKPWCAGGLTTSTFQPFRAVTSTFQQFWLGGGGRDASKVGRIQASVKHCWCLVSQNSMMISLWTRNLTWHWSGRPYKEVQNLFFTVLSHKHHQNISVFV